MIGKLKGMVDAVGESYVIVDVNGVGYEVQASARTLRTLKVGETVSLAIETHVREDAIRLYGFTSEIERAWFRTLQTIQGVGAKVALAVLGTLAPQDLANAIALQNWAAVEQSPGVGKKLAQRIVAELKDKAPALSVAGLNVPAAALGQGRAGPAHNDTAAEAISALDQSRLSARAGEPGGRGGHGRAGRGGRHAQAHSPRPEGAGTLGSATGRPQFEPTRPLPCPTSAVLLDADLPPDSRTLAQRSASAGHGLRDRLPVGHVRRRRRLHPHAAADLPRRAAGDRGRHQRQPGGGGVRFERTRPLAAQQRRRAHGPAADLGRLRGRHDRRRRARHPESARPARYFRRADLRHAAGRGRRPHADRERAHHARLAGEGGRRAGTGAASTPGSKACRSRRASAIPASTPAPSRSWPSAPSSACSPASWASAAAFC